MTTFLTNLFSGYLDTIFLLLQFNQENLFMVHEKDYKDEDVGPLFT